MIEALTSLAAFDRAAGITRTDSAAPLARTSFLSLIHI